MMRLNVTKKTDSPAKSSKSSHIDSAARCPLSVYIDLVCEDNLQGLILSGQPSEQDLMLAKQTIIAEFHEATGSEEVKDRIALFAEVYKSKNQILGLSIAHDCILMDTYDNCFEFLASVSIRAKEPKNEKEKTRLLKQIESRIKVISVKLNGDIEKLNKESKEEKKEKKPTMHMFNEQIAEMSKFMGFYIDREKVTVLEYAGYLKTLKNSIDHGRQRKFDTR